MSGFKKDSGEDFTKAASCMDEEMFPDDQIADLIISLLPQLANSRQVYRTAILDYCEKLPADSEISGEQLDRALDEDLYAYIAFLCVNVCGADDKIAYIADKLVYSFSVDLDSLNQKAISIGNDLSMYIDDEKLAAIDAFASTPAKSLQLLSQLKHIENVDVHGLAQVFLMAFILAANYMDVYCEIAEMLTDMFYYKAIDWISTQERYAEQFGPVSEGFTEYLAVLNLRKKEALDD